MRVILLMNSLFTGGAEFSTLTFYSWLKLRGHEIKLVVLKEATPCYDHKRFGFDELIVLNKDSFRMNAQALNAIIKQFKPHLLHSVLFDANLLGRFCRIFSGTFFHLESLVNEIYSEKRFADPRVTRFKLFGYRMLDFITGRLGTNHYHANGNSVAIHYQEKLWIDVKKITVIPRGRNANLFYGNQSNCDETRQNLKTGDSLLLINVARQEYQKGQDILLDALAGLLPDELRKIKLLIVGREGNQTSLLQKKIKQHKLEDSVMMLGHRNDVESLLAAADVFVFPSRFEGLPGALIEAEAAGLPIICSDIPNNHEVADKDNALFFPVDDVANLTQALRVLIHDGVKREAMSKQSLSIFQNHFLLENIHLRMESLLLSLTNQAKIK